MGKRRAQPGKHSKTPGKAAPPAKRAVLTDRKALRELHAAEKKRARLAKKGLPTEPAKVSKRKKKSEPPRVPQRRPTAQRDIAPRAFRETVPASARRRHEAEAPFVPRRRKRWKPVLFLLCLLALVALLGSLYYFTGLFHVKDIEVTGCTHLNPDYIRALSGISRDTRFFGVNAGEVEKALKSEFWVESVTIQRKLPLKLVIRVKERQPWALVPMVGRLFSVDVSGVVLEELAAAGPALPMILDLPPRAVTPGDSVAGAQFQTCADVLLSMPVDLTGRFLSVSSTVSGEVTLVTQEGMRVIYGTATDEQTKNLAIRALLQEPGANPAGLEYLDVSVPDRPVIKPR